MIPCPLCAVPAPAEIQAEARWYPFWEGPGGACPACVQQHLLRTLLEHGDAGLHEAVQTHWPLDAEAAFGVLPTPLRLHADPRFAGRGVTLAMVDSGFYPHPDLTRPANRIRAWVDASRDPIEVRRATPHGTPRWPGWDGARDWQWHGTMTSVVAAGNGFLSHGLYRGLASEAELVLIQVRDERGHIGNAAITRALRWLHEERETLGVRVVSLSVSGDPVHPLAGNPVDAAVEQLVADGVVVVAAAGNDGERRLVPPATAPFAVTVGGLDDRNTLSHAERALWHGNYGESNGGAPKPELVAPSIWVVAPVLPGTDAAREAVELFDRRASGEDDAARRIAERKLVTPHYQHVEGTSFAAPVVAAAAACMLEANPALAPLLVRDILAATAHRVPGAPADRQGAGALDSGLAVARAVAERHGRLDWPFSPVLGDGQCRFRLHAHDAGRVEVRGSWNGWGPEAVAAEPVEPGLWMTGQASIPPGRHAYKFLLDGARWLDDPANPRKVPDGQGGFNSILDLQ